MARFWAGLGVIFLVAICWAEEKKKIEKDKDDKAVPIQCPAGWTGATCDIVMCLEKGEVFPQDGMQGFGVPIDAVTQTTGCLNQHLRFPIDSHVTRTYIHLQALSGNPTFTVTHPNGAGVLPSNIIQSDDTNAFFEYDGLLPGDYLVQYSADIATCSLMIRANTDLTISSGFTSGDDAIHDDDPMLGSLSEYTKSTYVAHVNGLGCPGHLSVVNVYLNGQLQPESGALKPQTRYGCAYDYYAGPVYCSAA